MATTTTPRPPTARQAEVLRAVWRHLSERGVYPTREELAAEFGWASPNAPTSHLKRLAAKGYLARGATPRLFRASYTLAGVRLIHVVSRGGRVRAVPALEGEAGLRLAEALGLVRGRAG